MVNVLWDFLIRNEGGIVGSFGAALVAILAVFLADLRQKRREKRIHEGVLVLLHTELGWQQKTSETLRNGIESMKGASVDVGAFIIDKSPNCFDNNALKEFRSTLISYEGFRHDILALLSTIMNKMDEINASLDFRAASRVSTSLDKLHLTRDAIREYFDSILNNCVRLEEGIKSTRMTIENVLPPKRLEQLVNRERT